MSSIITTSLIFGLIVLSVIFVILLRAIFRRSQTPHQVTTPPQHDVLNTYNPPTLPDALTDSRIDTMITVWEAVAQRLGMRFIDTRRDNTPGLCTLDGDVHGIGLSLVALKRQDEENNTTHITLLSASLPHDLPLNACTTIVRTLQKKSPRAAMSAFHCSYELPHTFRDHDAMHTEILSFVNLILEAAAPHRTQANPIPPSNPLHQTQRSSPNAKTKAIAPIHLCKTTPAPPVRKHQTQSVHSAPYIDEDELEDTVQDSGLHASMLREHIATSNNR